MDKETKKNHVNEMQNEPFSIDMLSAQRHYYSQAKLIVYTSLFFCVIVVAVLSVLNRFYSSEILGKTVLMYSLLAFILSSMLTNYRNKLQNLAARIQHLFDIKLFGLKWDTALCGIEPRVEEVKRGKQKKQNKLDYWYKDIPDDLPLDAVTLVCLRMNVEYDKSMKQNLSLLLYIVVSLFAIIIVIANNERTIWDMVLYSIVPLLPVSKFLYDVKRRIDSDKERLVRLDVSIDSLMKKAIQEGVIEKEELQNINNQIFEHRRTSPLVPDWLYDMLRDKEEETAAYSAKYYFGELRKKL
jgi:hypothetical protein